jgi:CBS-domain-containing membrane protein
VINAEQQLLGIIGRADMIAALFEIRLSQQHA